MLIAADNLHVVDTRIAAAMEALDPEPIRRCVRECIDAGAQAIDINPGPLGRNPEKRFTFLVETVQQATDMPLLLDTTSALALRAGLAVCRNKAIINGFSLEPAKLDAILPLAQEYDTDIIGYLISEKSQVPIEADDMMALAVAVYEQFSRTGLDGQRLIIDPIIVPVSWQEGIRHNQAVLQVIPALKELIGMPVRTIAGLSNLATGPVGKNAKASLECAFVPMLAAAGLDMVLMNVRHAQTLRTIHICDTLLGHRIFSWAQVGNM